MLPHCGHLSVKNFIPDVSERKSGLFSIPIPQSRHFPCSLPFSIVVMAITFLKLVHSTEKNNTEYLIHHS
jgi:hypothetical protein